MIVRLIEPFQDVTQYCLKCKKVAPILEKYERGEKLTDDELSSIRWDCWHCRSFNGKGIYKADAIISALMLHLKMKKRMVSKWGGNKGRKPVREKEYKESIKNLREQGYTIIEIAKILGISKQTVNNITKKYNYKKGKEVVK